MEKRKVCIAYTLGLKRQECSLVLLWSAVMAQKIELNLKRQLLVFSWLTNEVVESKEQMVRSHEQRWKLHFPFIIVTYSARVSKGYSESVKPLCSSSLSTKEGT